MAANDMNHLAYIDLVARADADVLRAKEATYQGSWKRAGGRSAWFMFRRNMDRLLAMCAHVPFALPPERVFRALERGGPGLTLSHSEVETLQKSLRSEDLFALIRAEPSGADGTVLACLRDLRRYAVLVEAEMVSEGVVEIEGLGEPAKTITAPEIKLDADVIAAADLGRVEQAALAREVRVFDSVRLARLIAIADGGTRTAEAYSELGRKAAEKLESGGDIYSTIADLLDIKRQVVKERLFVEMYHGGSPTKLGDLITSEISPDEAAVLIERFREASISAKEFLVPARGSDGRILTGDAQSQPVDTYEEKAIAQALRYLDTSSQIGGDVVFVEGISPGAVLALRPGGSVNSRIAELVGTTEDNILEHIVQRAYAPPRETEAKDPPIALHKQISAAVSHALNYHSIDAALSTPDHILAELLVPQIVAHILKQTGPQLVEAGWTIGAGGVPVPPPPALPDEPRVPGTPADGGHHSPRCGAGGEGARMVPRQDIVPLDTDEGAAILRGRIASCLVGNLVGLVKITVRVADHGARRHSGPNATLHFIGSRDHRHLLVSASGRTWDVNTWKIATNDRIRELASIWFRDMPSEIRSLSVSENPEALYEQVVADGTASTV